MVAQGSEVVAAAEVARRLAFRRAGDPHSRSIGHRQVTVLHAGLRMRSQRPLDLLGQKRSAARLLLEQIGQIREEAIGFAEAARRLLLQRAREIDRGLAGLFERLVPLLIQGNSEQCR